MVKRITVFVLIISLTGLFFFSCVKKETNKNIQVVKYFSRSTPEQLAIWNKVLDQFMDENPDIKVIIENVSYQQYWDKLLTMIAAGESPDIVFMESTRLPKFISKQALVPIDDLIKKDTDIHLNDFYPEAIEAYRMNNRIYGLPNDVAVIVYFYNKDMFDREGIAYPKDNWTWDDIVRIGKQLTKDKNNDGRIDQYGMTAFPWKHAILQNKGSIVDNTENPQKSTFYSKAVKEALQFCVDLTFKHKIAPPASWFQSQQGHQMFLAQKVAMTPEGHWMVPKFRQANFKWDVVALPKGKIRAGLNYGSCFSIPQGSKNVEAAWRVIKYLTGEKGQEIIVESGFSTPALRSIAKSKYFLSGKPENARAFLKMLQYGKPDVKSANVLEVETIYREEMDLMWLGKVSVQEAVSKVDDRANKTLKR